MPLYRDVGDGHAPAGIEYYLPLFFESTSTLFDYLPDAALIVLPDGHRSRARQRRCGRSTNATRNIATTSSTPCSRPAEIFVEPPEWLSPARGRPHVELAATDAPPVEDDATRVDRARPATRRPCDSTCVTRTASGRSPTRCAPADRVCCSPPNPRAAVSCCSTCCARTVSRRGSSRAGTSSWPRASRSRSPWRPSLPVYRSPSRRSRSTPNSSSSASAPARSAAGDAATATRPASSSSSPTCALAHRWCTRTMESGAIAV